MAKRPAKSKTARPKRNPVARSLSEGRYRPRQDRPRKGKGSYRRLKADADEKP
jgi:stalled ribosome alternative rescue factor ArfA